MRNPFLMLTLLILLHHVCAHPACGELMSVSICVTIVILIVQFVQFSFSLLHDKSRCSAHCFFAHVLHKTSYDKYVSRSSLFIPVCLSRFWLHVENLHFMKNLNGLFKRCIFGVLQFAAALSILLHSQRTSGKHMNWNEV